MSSFLSGPLPGTTPLPSPQPPSSDAVTLQKVDPGVLPLLGTEGDLSAFKEALQKQLNHCINLRKNLGNQDGKTEGRARDFVFGARQVSRETWCIDTNQKFLELAQNASSFSDLMAKASSAFDWYRYEDFQGEPRKVLFTGYDAPTLEASLTPTADMQVPLYRQPPDLVDVFDNGEDHWRERDSDGSYTLFPDRKAIDIDGVLKGQGLELAYITDWYSAFVLQIQGSGRLNIHTPQGIQSRFINYAAQNGRPYVSIGHYLKEQGVPEEELTEPGMRRYFQDHPDQLMPVLSQNPSYVFFQFEDDGPYGCEHVILTPHHSIAVDPQYVPLGAVTLFQTQRPVSDEIGNGTNPNDWKSFSTLAVAQDIGGAIQGPGRVDIFWGGDAYAEEASGLMHHPGSLFIALVKDTALKDLGK